MKIQACAKINLGLNIVARRPDGYHDLQTVFYPVRIFDDIEIAELPESKPGTVELCMDGQPVEGDPESNLVVRAYRLLAARHQLPPVRITLTKRIPMQAGMGGGSADGAYTLRLLNAMFRLGETDESLQRLSAGMGADCAFFIQSQPAYAEGIGERLQPIALDLSAYRMAIVKPPVAVSTREAFAHVRPRMPEVCPRDAVQRPITEWKDCLTNDFEESIFPQYPVIATGKQRLYDLGAVYAAMSGSGSALFGLFPADSDPQLNESFPSDWYLRLV